MRQLQHCSYHPRPFSMSSAPNSPSPSSPSLKSPRSSLASSPFDVTLPEVPVDRVKELDANANKRRHPQYYFEDGNVVFLIEDTLYNVHRYFFARDSTHFRATLQDTASYPYVMQDVSCADFDEFLAILYPTNFRRPMEKTATQWTSILHLAAKWGFENIKLLAIDNLAANVNPVDKIVLGRQYGIAEWLPAAYQTVCTRADPLTMEEGVKLGVEDTVKISAARQLYGIGKARYDVKHLSGDLAEIFRLEMPAESVLSGEEDAIKVLEPQPPEAWKEYLASQFIAVGICTNPSQTLQVNSDGYDYFEYTDCGSCRGCKPESNAQVADAQTESLARPTPPVGACTHPTEIETWDGNRHYSVVTNCGFCVCCTLAADQHRVKRKAMEEKERQPGDLNARLEERRQGLAGRLGRMSSFR
ncbi:hypothetical protein FIBSPDRAFT_799853 [Athelia psychrophila]|uniref:BTB domain-containing protein n=1 Tax=Athelia psychrophila TaxID=1759441 RepID=A0A166AQM8_9AGAM|nr:hypothetical protein FIBSPDRAFT_799853 [Fibularhizoctonia sp. CBS 109695]